MYQHCPSCKAPVVFSQLLCAFCLFCGSTVYAQQISGSVRDPLGVSLPGVHVYIESLERGAVTDINGAFVISNVASGTYLLKFSFVGFNDLQSSVTIVSEDVTIDVVLTPGIIESDELLIEEERVDVLTQDKRAVSVLEGRELEAIRGQTLGETLEELPGVTALQTGPSISKPVVRGLHSQRVLVLNAGVAQEGQQWGGEHAPEIDPFAPVRIQVIKGVSGVEYGVGAIGGVIRLDPLELPYIPGEGVKGDLSLNGFSNNMQGAGALYLESASGLVPGLGWRVQGSYRKAGDAHTPDYVIRNSAFEEFNGSVSAGIQRDRLNLVALYSRFSTELGIYSGAHFGNLNDLLRAIERTEPSFIGEFGYDIAPPKQKIAHNLISIHGDFHLSSGSWLELQYGFQVNRRQEFDAHGRDEDKLNEPAFDLSLVSNSGELKFHHKPVGEFFGVAGVSAMTQLNKNDATGFIIPNFRSYSMGVFARESWVQENLTLEAGGRFDYHWVRAWPRELGSRGDFVQRISDYASLSGVMGGIWQFTTNWSMGVNVGSSWRPPSVNELYNFGVHHGTAQFEIGNAELGRERSVGIDATLRHNSERSRFEFSAYNNWFDGFIYLFPEAEPRVTIRGTFPTFSYQQADAVLRGFETSFEHDATRWLTLGTQFSLVRGDNLSSDEPLINMPSDRLSVEASFKLPSSRRVKDTAIDFEGVFVQKQSRVPENADYAPPPDGYALFNAGVSSTLSVSGTDMQLNLELHNVLDTAYRDYLSRFRYFIDDPGRSLILRVNIPLGSER